MPYRLEIRKIPAAVVGHFLDRIGDGTLQPGDKLPPQRELAKALGVGLSSLREGLHSLETLGILEVKRGKGTFITREASEGAAKGLRLALGGPGAKLIELLEVRGMFETEVATLAAERATEENVRELDRLLSSIRQAIQQGDRRSLEELDVRFHIAIAEATQNRMASRLVSILYSLAREMMREIPYTSQQLERHQEVASAIRRGDPEAARIAARALVDSVRQAIEAEPGAPHEE